MTIGGGFGLYISQATQKRRHGVLWRELSRADTLLFVHVVALPTAHSTRISPLGEICGVPTGTGGGLRLHTSKVTQDRRE